MTVNHEVFKVLADRYFPAGIPSDLKLYLIDAYGEEPLRGDLSEQFFWPQVISDVELYIKGKLDITVRSDYQKLQDRYDELSDITSEFARDRYHLMNENRYLRDFVSWMHLDSMYQEFRMHAHKEMDELGMFSRYVM